MPYFSRIFPIDSLTYLWYGLGVHSTQGIPHGCRNSKRRIQSQLGLKWIERVARESVTNGLQAKVSLKRRQAVLECGIQLGGIGRP